MFKLRYVHKGEAALSALNKLCTHVHEAFIATGVTRSFLSASKHHL